MDKEIGGGIGNKITDMGKEGANIQYIRNPIKTGIESIQDYYNESLKYPEEGDDIIKLKTSDIHEWMFLSLREKFDISYYPIDLLKQQMVDINGGNKEDIKYEIDKNGFVTLSRPNKEKPSFCVKYCNDYWYVVIVTLDDKSIFFVCDSDIGLGKLSKKVLEEI